VSVPPDGLTEEMFEVCLLRFASDTPFEKVNGRLAEYPGWEPFATQLIDSGGWALLLKRPVQA
jgi:hypothetical protein